MQAELRRGLLATAVAAIAALAAAPGAEGGVRHALPAPVVGLAADGGRAAVLVGDPTRGTGQVRVVWNLRTGRSVDVPVHGPAFFPPSGDALPRSAGTLANVALAGRRVLWRERFGGNVTEERLRQASTLDPVPRRVGGLVRHEDERGIGTYLAGLVGDGPTLAYAVLRFGLTDPDHCTGQAGDPPGVCELVQRGGVLRVLSGGGMRALARGPRTPHAQTADRGRIAALRPGGDAVLLSAAGGPPLEIDLGGDRPLGVALQGDDLVVLRGLGRLEHRRPDGALRRSFGLRHFLVTPFRGGPLRLDVHDGVAVYTLGRVAYGLRLRDGRRRALVRFPTVPVGLAIEEGGLTYAWNSGPRRRTGHLGWMPLEEVRARLAAR